MVNHMVKSKALTRTRLIGVNMAEVEKSTLDNNVRKLRKKLRQIENLQRLYGVRELSDEESAKVL